MKKSYHSIAVPTAEATTARRTMRRRASGASVSAAGAGSISALLLARLRIKSHSAQTPFARADREVDKIALVSKHVFLLVIAALFFACAQDPAATSDAGEQSTANDAHAATQDATNTPDSGVVIADDATTAFEDAAEPAPDAEPIDAGAPDSGRIPIFVAQGEVGRTTISCDDGRTWIANHSWDVDDDPLLCDTPSPVVCWMGSADYLIGGECRSMQPCNDTPDVAKGVIYGAGAFVATWGWGRPGVIRRSTNGVDWTTTHADDSFGGIKYGAGRFVAASRFPVWSSDGTTWTSGQEADFRSTTGTTIWSVRRFAFLDYDTGRFVAVGRGDENSDILVSSDGGASWHRPSTLAPECGDLDLNAYGDLLSGNGIIVAVDTNGTVCRSLDGGDTWLGGNTGVNEIYSRGVWTGSEFWIWGQNMRLSSTDGASWTATPQVTDVRLEGPVAISANGTLVAGENEWNGYDQQNFLRSTDGLTWDSLPSNAFTHSHPIFSIAFGDADPSAECGAH